MLANRSEKAPGEVERRPAALAERVVSAQHNAWAFRSAGTQRYGRRRGQTVSNNLFFAIGRSNYFHLLGGSVFGGALQAGKHQKPAASQSGWTRS